MVGVFPPFKHCNNSKNQTNKQQQQTKEGKRDATAVLRVLPCNESSLALTLEKKTKSLAVNGLLARWIENAKRLKERRYRTHDPPQQHNYTTRTATSQTC